MEKLAQLPPKILFIVSVAVGLFYYLTLFDSGSFYDTQIESVKNEIKGELEKKKKTEEILNKEKEMKVNVETLTKQYFEISKKIPSSLNSIDISRMIEQLAKKSGVEVKGKKPGNPIKNKIFEEVPVELIMSGNYSELAQFIYFVAIHEKIMRIKTFTIDSQTDSKKLKFSGTLIGYRLSEDKSEGPVEGASPGEGGAPVVDSSGAPK